MKSPTIRSTTALAALLGFCLLAAPAYAQDDAAALASNDDPALAELLADGVALVKKKQYDAAIDLLELPDAQLP